MTVTWPPRDRTLFGEYPHRYALDSCGRRVGFIRELATRDGYRVSLFPDGNHEEATEGRMMFPNAPLGREDNEIVPKNEELVIKMATRWLERHL